jgi:hypothetical protein
VFSNESKSILNIIILLNQNNTTDDSKTPGSILNAIYNYENIKDKQNIKEHETLVNNTLQLFDKNFESLISDYNNKIDIKMMVTKEVLEKAYIHLQDIYRGAYIVNETQKSIGKIIEPNVNISNEIIQLKGKIGNKKSHQNGLIGRIGGYTVSGFQGVGYLLDGSVMAPTTLLFGTAFLLYHVSGNILYDKGKQISKKFTKALNNFDGGKSNKPYTHKLTQSSQHKPTRKLNKRETNSISQKVVLKKCHNTSKRLKGV